MSSEISVIIPMFNAEKYIEGLFDSLDNQTYKNFDVIIVNDGSTDNTKEILRDCMSKVDWTVKVYDVVNGGVSSARNLGLKKAKSKYIMFLDSDDIIPPDYIGIMFEEITLNRADIVISNIKINGNKENKLLKVEPKVYDISKHTIKNIDRLINDMLFNSVSNKLYKLELIKKYKLKFNIKMEMGEDFDFNIKYFSQIKKIVQASKIAYQYNVDNSFLTKKVRDNEFENRVSNIKSLEIFFGKYEFEKDLSFFYIKLVYADIIELIKKYKFKSIIYYSDRTKYLLKYLENYELKPQNNIVNKILYTFVNNNMKFMIYCTSLLIYIIKKFKILKWSGASI